MAQDIVIGGRLHSAATGNTVAGANEILDDAKGKKQNVINQEVDNEIGSDSAAGTIKGRIKNLETAVGSGGSVDERISEAAATVKSEVTGDAASDYNTLGKVEDKIQAETSRAEAAEGALDNAKANKATTLEGYGITDAYTKSETYTKTEVNGLVDTPHQNYVTVLTYAALIAIDPGSTDTIYRVSNYDGSVPQVDVTKYSEYAWDGTQYVFLCVKSQIDEVFDISVYNNNATYADLSAALGTDGANVPQTLRRGGMSVKFVHSVDNKYVQWRLMANSFSTIVSDWQGVDTEASPNSKNLIESGAVFDNYEAIADTTPIEHTAFEGGLISPDGTVHPEYGPYGYRYCFANVTPGDNIHISFNRTGGGDYYYIICYDSNNDVVDHLFFVLDYSKVIFDEDIHVPNNCVKIGLNIDNITDISKYGERILSRKLKEDIQNHQSTLDSHEARLDSDEQDIESIISDISEDPQMIETGTKLDGFIQNNGVLNPFPGYYHKFVDVVPNSEIRITTHSTGGGGFSMLVFFGSDDSVISTMYPIEDEGTILINQLVTVPDNAVKMAVNNDYVVVIYNRGGVIKNKDLLSGIKENTFYLSTRNPVALSEVQEGFVNNAGEVDTRFAGYQHRTATVTPLAEYYIKTGNTGGGGISMIVCFSADDEVLTTLYPITSSAGISLDNTITIPNNVVKIAINNADVELSSAGEPIYSEELQHQIDDLSESLNWKMIVSFDTINKRVNVRSSFNDTQDLVIQYFYDVINKNIAPVLTFLGNKEWSLENIIAQGWVHYTEDSIAPLATSNYWFIAGEHGYLIPSVTSTGHDKTNDDINSVWEDSAGHRYTLAQISGDDIILAPAITVNGGGQGKDTRDWNAYDTIPGTTLTHVSGATHTNAIVFSAQEAIQYRPITRNVNRKFIVDGKVVIPTGVYYCNKLNVIDEYVLVNPAKVSNWTNPSSAEALITICQNYHFDGLTVTLDQTLLPNYSVWLDYWGAIQPLGLRSLTRDNIAYKPLIVMPNSKIKDGLNFNMPVDCSAGDNSKSISFFKNEYTQNEEIPNRIVQWLESSNNEKLIGFASGYSLQRSDTVKAKRWDNIQNILVTFANDDRNKLYIRATEQMMQPGEVLHYTTFYSYFDPNKNTEKVYYYKEGDSTIVYIESFAANAISKIELPEELDGKSFEVVTKTNGVTMLSDTSICNVIYATFDSNPNYVILKF